jgi:hypothetical protein
MGRALKNFGNASNRHRLPQTGIPNYAKKSLDEQVALFSKLVMANSKTPIYRLWSKIDSVARSVIMAELGCFDGKDAPQVARASRDERDRDLVAELERHTRLLERVLHKRAKHDYVITRRFGFRNFRKYLGVPGRVGSLRQVLKTEIKHLKQVIAVMKRELRHRGKWDVKGMVIAQEYVIRRAAFLGITRRVRLTPDAIADIYQLTRAPGADSNGSDTAENVRKAIAYFRKRPENAHFLDHIESHLKDWTVPVPLGRTGNLVRPKKHP